MNEKKKYIVEAGDDIQLITLTGVKDGSAITITGVIDTFETAEKLEEAYERGLKDAWDIVKKLAMMDTETSEEATGYFGLFRIMENLTPEEAISKLSAYEKEQKNKIHVGDEIKQVTDSGKETGLVCIVTYISGDSMNGIQHNGCMVLCSSQVGRWWKKTGRRFDIKAILEGMQE